MRPHLIVAIAALVALAAPSTASADPFEPNDHIDQTWGPVQGGQTYTGMIDTENDEDWYRVNFAGQQQVSISFPHGPYTEECTRGLSDAWYVRGYVGDQTTAVMGSSIRGRTVTTYTTPPNGGTYYLVWRAFGERPGCTYSFVITPASAVQPTDPPTPQRIGVPEPNEMVRQAFGPLQGGVLYTGAIETSNDSDWLMADLRANTDVTVEFTRPGFCLGPEASDRGMAAGQKGGIAVYPFEDGDPTSALWQEAAYQNERFVRSFKTDAAGRYGFSVSGDLGCPWQLMLRPASAVLGGSPGAQPSKTGSRKSRASFAARVTLKRGGRRFSGRLSSASDRCERGRTVVLRRVGSGTRSFGRDRTSRSGRFVIRNRSRKRGRYYVVVAERSTSSLLCRVARSRTR